MKTQKAIALMAALCFSALTISAQEDSASTKSYDPGVPFKPTLSAGVGMLTYYGDVARGQKANSAIVSRTGFDLSVTQKLNPYLDGSFFVMIGKIGANELSANRNINFLSTITAGGINVRYNFDHLLERPRMIEPYVTIGIEAFEFLTKTDLADRHGNTYHYWSDGSIRNIDENAPNSGESIRLERDFKYESDVRSMNQDGFGKYSEKSYAIPMGAGVNINLTEWFSFRMGTTFHYTFTDYIDGITKDSKGTRQGKSGNDHFLYTSAALSYHIGFGKHADPFDFENLSDEDRLLAEADTDGDGVMDFRDKCPSTDDGVEVDSVGCPLDGDRDLVANHKDLELESPDSSMVDLNGVTLTEEALMKKLNQRYDTTGAFAVMEDTLEFKHNSDKSLGGTTGKKYTVKIGEINGGIDRELAEELLSIPDINTWEENGVTYITAGSFDNLPDALKRKLELASQGFEKPELAAEKDGKIKSAETSETKAKEKAQSKANAQAKSPKPGEGGYVEPTPLSDPSGKIIYRVQIGAYSKRVGRRIFEGVPDLVAVPFEDGITRYFSGSFETYKPAATRKVDMVLDGFEGAFVVAFKDGKRIALGKTGAATPVPGVSTQEDLEKIPDDTKTSSVNKKLVKFRVQIGVYRDQVPADLLKVFMTLKDVENIKTEEGLTRYISGTFDTYEAAAEHKNMLIKKGVTGAFVIGNFKGKLITAQEAIELSK